MTDSRFPRSVYSRGAEPDARFSLANERTFLSWISVGVALISVGVGLETFAAGLHPGLRLAASVLLILAGIACPAQAWVGWARTEIALREQRPLPSSPLIAGLAIVVVVAGALVGLGLVVR